MATRVLAQRQALAQKFADDNGWAAVFTADPGTSGGFTGEVSYTSGGRGAITWGAPDSGNPTTITGTATVNVPGSITVTYASACTSATVGRASDPQPTTSTPIGSPTSITITIVRTET